MPLLVVDSAGNPAASSMRALPAFQALGARKVPGLVCSLRNCSAFASWSCVIGLLLEGPGRGIAWRTAIAARFTIRPLRPGECDNSRELTRQFAGNPGPLRVQIRAGDPMLTLSTVISPGGSS